MIGATQNTLALVIENDAVLNRTLCRELSESGLRTYGLATIASALKYLSTQPAPALVVIDFVLPDGNGNGLIDFLKNASFANTRVIVLLDGDATYPSQARIDLVLMKPVQISKLISLAQSLLAQK